MPRLSPLLLSSLERGKMLFSLQQLCEEAHNHGLSCCTHPSHSIARARCEALDKIFHSFWNLTWGCCLCKHFFLLCSCEGAANGRCCNLDLLLTTAWLSSDFLMVCDRLVTSSGAGSQSSPAAATSVPSVMSRVAQPYRLWRTRSTFSCRQRQELFLPPLLRHDSQRTTVFFPPLRITKLQLLVIFLSWGCCSSASTTPVEKGSSFAEVADHRSLWSPFLGVSYILQHLCWGLHAL